MTKEGLIKSSIRSFLKAFSFLIGVAVAIIIIVMGVSLLAEKCPEPVKYSQPSALPKGDGTLSAPSPSKQTLLSIPIHGFIGSKKMDVADVEMQLISAIHFASKKEDIKAIILNVNSGGGFGVSSQQIYNTLLQYSKIIDCPIYAFIDGISASGAYLISCASSKIYSTEYSIIGSVGSKFTDFFNFSKFMEAHGVEAKNLHAGKYKDPMNPFVPWDDKANSQLETLLENDYHLFVDLVAKNRPKLSKEQLINRYGAQVFSASESLSYGFIDESISSYYDMLNMVKQELNLDEDYQILNFTHVGLIESLVENVAELPQSSLMKLSETKHPSIYTP